MQDDTLIHADTFFFVTTIAVVVSIAILVVILFISFRVLRSVRGITARVEKMVDKTSEGMESGPASAAVKKGLPFVLSVVSLFAKKGKKVAKRQ